MPLEFQLDIDKVLATAVFIARQDVPELTVGKMMKLIFLADKYHLVRYGRPITGDRYEAMNDGPVPSFAYDLFKQILRKPFTKEGRALADALTIDNAYQLPRFSSKAAFDPEQLSESDIVALQQTLRQFADRSFEELSSITHTMAAYDRAWKSRKLFRKSSPMKFEDFFDDDAGAVAGAKEEMIENHHLQKTFAKP
jgi:uncharacterized phage-associated protein